MIINDIKKLDYWELREIVKDLIPRRLVLTTNRDRVGAVKEKGRKSNYSEFNLKDREWRKHERLLNTEEVNSFLEISIRAAACPMPFNIDVWDGLLCPFGCKYCFADAFRASLYTAFFDNSKTMGIRHCNPTYYKKELDKLMTFRGKDPHGQTNEIRKAIAMEIPMRLGIRFEDFTKLEARGGVSLEVLKYLGSIDYPVMINTKSDLLGQDEYLTALSSNKGKAAVHITMISSDENLLKTIEPGAPPFAKRIRAAKALTDAGVRVVARIEPFMTFINDDREAVKDYMKALVDAGVKHITFDTYSYSANNPGIRQSFVRAGFDFDRMFLLTSDSQGIGSLLLTKFMNLFQDEGFSCSTFDLGNAPTNNDSVCCEVGDHFEGGFNYGSAVYAARLIIAAKGVPVRWKDFEDFVMERGGFLSARLREDLKRLWNLEGNDAFNVNWSQGIEPAGRDEDGIVWKYFQQHDFRETILKGTLK